MKGWGDDTKVTSPNKYDQNCYWWREMSRSGKYSCKRFIDILSVWVVVPSCCKLKFPYIHFLGLGRNNDDMILFKKKLSANNANSGYCTLITHTFCMQRMLVKIPSVLLSSNIACFICSRILKYANSPCRYKKQRWKESWGRFLVVASTRPSPLFIALLTLNLS